MDYTEINKKYWDERVTLHKESDFYGVDAFKKGMNTLTKLELTELGDITGKSILHLQCHFGLDTLSLKRMGASEVTGVDFSGEAIKDARGLSKETGIEAEFIESDIYTLPEKLNKQFDIVHTSYGVLGWLNDIKKWGETVSKTLKHDGFFYIAEIHPVSYIFEKEEGVLKYKFPYFAAEEPLEFNEAGSYADRNAETTNNTTYEWVHSLSDIIMALINAGLKIEFLHEHAYTGWEQFPGMTTDTEGLKRMEENIPLLFSLKATKQ